MKIKIAPVSVWVRQVLFKRMYEYFSAYSSRKGQRMQDKCSKMCRIGGIRRVNRRRRTGDNRCISQKGFVAYAAGRLERAGASADNGGI